MCITERRLLDKIPCSALLANGAGDGVDGNKLADFIQRVASRDRRQIVTVIHYPLYRPYPIKAIRSRRECLRRFEEVFYEKLLSEIAHSAIEGEDWQRVGWRGIIFRDGDIWLNDDY